MGTEAFTTGAFSRGARGGDTTGLGHALANSDPGLLSASSRETSGPSGLLS